MEAFIINLPIIPFRFISDVSSSLLANIMLMLLGRLDVLISVEGICW
ncbi:hypothetical protein VCRA2119O147_150017 [Vibrio crassostreae]|nr:hypothetical protein VCRA2112O187_30081 [Vibrio crassostreae]CAK2191906.1 hypothetical protein VCRA2110O135_80130 [Vibrio crassostreae]CAK2199494.1 hypothetical protein VCRA2113O138_70088 [Vibrio crassostreae]CAK2204756.1 hypothetical protein VCRA2113O120_80111 [Vibrio crassostreae]CAK2206078.1 hypothetical protein VCRA2119O245_60123 [Vibrio crassostreae]